MTKPARSHAMITLEAGEWRATLLPAAGGSIGSLTCRGRDVLRPSPDGTLDPLETACFPLTPYPNRIAHGRFTFAGEDYALPLNYGDHPHPLHGTGWRAAWDVAEAGETSARLVHEHPGGAAWPWRCHSEQSFVIDERGLHATLSVENRDGHAMPAGLGFHPYFPRTSGATIRAGVDGVWLIDATVLPTERVPASTLGDWANGAPVERETLVDHSFDGWDGSALIEVGDMTVRMEGSPARVFHLYLPPGLDFFCAEPVTNLPDAINRDELTVLAPGERMTLEMRISLANG
jgi:aldose 1-epimerase